MTTEIRMATINTPRCWQCGKTGELQISSDIYFAGIKKLDEGALIQNAFPSLSSEQREQIMTGIHPECWKKMFPPEQIELNENGVPVNWDKHPNNV